MSGGTPRMNAATMCEVLKMLRRSAMNVAQVAREFDVDASTSARWLEEFEQHGILAAAEVHTGGTGRPARLYTVAQAWGGEGL